jgi:hypothetical protein
MRQIGLALRLLGEGGCTVLGELRVRVDVIRGVLLGYRSEMGFVRWGGCMGAVYMH